MTNLVDFKEAASYLRHNPNHFGHCVTVRCHHDDEDDDDNNDEDHDDDDDDDNDDDGDDDDDDSNDDYDLNLFGHCVTVLCGSSDD